MTQDELMYELVRNNGAILYWQLPRDVVAQAIMAGLCRFADDDCVVHCKAIKIGDGAYAMSTEPLNRLIAEYAAWNKAQGLNLGSADEHLFDENLTDEQREWLRVFCERWESVA